MGYCIESLKDIDEVITNMTNENYLTLTNNVAKVQTEIVSGHYLNTALTKAMNLLAEISSPQRSNKSKE